MMLVFFFVTILLGGGTSIMIGRAVAATWRPFWQVIAYCLLLSFVDRFIIYALFQGELLSLQGFITDSIVLITIGLLAYRLKLIRQMITQYPWLYERSGLIALRKLMK